MPDTQPRGGTMSEGSTGPTGPTTPERTVWQGTPSQAINLPVYVSMLLLGIAATVLVFFVRGAARTNGVVDGPDPAREGDMFLWLLALVWVGCVATALYQYLRVATTKYHVTSERLRITTGILSTLTEEVELRRVRDTSVAKPFFLRMIGLGDVNIRSDDSSATFVTLRAVRNPDGLQSQIRTLVMGLYERYRVREFDVM